MNDGITFWRVTCYGNGGSYYPPRPAGLDPCSFDRTVYTEQNMIRALMDHEESCSCGSIVAIGLEVPRA